LNALRHLDVAVLSSAKFRRSRLHGSLAG